MDLEVKMVLTLSNIKKINSKGDNMKGCSHQVAITYFPSFKQNELKRILRFKNSR